MHPNSIGENNENRIANQTSPRIIGFIPPAHSSGLHRSRFQNTQQLAGTFFATTGNELRHIEKAISIFISETKANTSLPARHPAVKDADESIMSFIDHKEPKATADFETGAVENKILNLTRSLLQTHKSFVEFM